MTITKERTCLGYDGYDCDDKLEGRHNATRRCMYCKPKFERMRMREIRRAWYKAKAVADITHAPKPKESRRTIANLRMRKDMNVACRAVRYRQGENIKRGAALFASGV